MFGIDSIEELNKTVKKRWIDNCAPFFKESPKESVFATGKSILASLGGIIGQITPVMKEITNAVLSINPMDFVAIKNSIGDSDDTKRVVLVFDDLERSKLDTVDILGCINEYYESQKFLVIIIANEDKIFNKCDSIPESQYTIDLETEPPLLKDSPENNDNKMKICGIIHKELCGLSYKEIKEKIVCRTLKFLPNYRQIIDNIIENDGAKIGIDYCGFLKRNNEQIINIFEERITDSNNEIIDKPKNIRSLRCAFRDFKRVFDLLNKHKEILNRDIDENFVAFVACMILAKAGLLNKKQLDGFLGSDSVVNHYFPGINIKVLFNSEMEWIFYGKWDEEKLTQEIDNRAAQSKDMPPKYRLRIENIMDMEDEDVYEGFHGLLKDSYDGLLSLDEYINLIRNSYFIRQYNINIPMEIDWDCVKLGIRKQIEYLIETRTKTGRSHLSISDENRNNFTKEELETYDLIKTYRDGGVVLEQNRILFLESIRKGEYRAISAFQGKRFKQFDEEMAQATINYYKACPQHEKNTFSVYFDGCFGNLDSEALFMREATLDGLGWLQSTLNQLISDYQEKNKQIACASTISFIHEVDRLVKKYS